METRNVAVTLNKAREWYNSGNAALKEVALQAYTDKELTTPRFTDIQTFTDACKTIGISYSDFNKMLHGYYGKNLFKKTPASVAAIKLNIIRQALNMGQKMELTKGTVYYPYTPFVTEGSTWYNDELRSGEMVEVAKFRYKGNTYRLLGGRAVNGGGSGLGAFDSTYGVGFSFASVGFLGCASKEIAEHMSRYFAKEILCAYHGDMLNGEIEWV